ncbi:lipid kinase [Chenggangzhangella methanolivorans]|uniref:Lipid kinase n=1 Tax=Chenggangzhangella methanolivorans TaxID=1437009 RepID=A0A9E6UM95_9HYPH|nr:lipid kinase [Chenggangzhangella methanolivorans]QZN99820.1 lipid kinase [Chenggangzhangella methanolivorans]
MTRRALLIVNSNSRSGAEALGTVVSGLRDRGIDPLRLDASSREDVSRLIVENRDGADMIVAAGGDGTLNATLRGALETGLPLGVLPVGTANDFARTLGLPVALEEAIAVVADGASRRVDVGLVNDQPFLNVASLGLSVALAGELSGDLKKRFGKLGYAIAAAKTLSKAKPFRARIVAGDRKVRALTLQIAVGNGKFYGGGNQVDEAAVVDDGLLDLYSLEFARAWKLVLMLKAMRFGQHRALKEIRNMRGAAFEVRTRRPRPVNADGEIVTETPARFAILPQALEVFVPRGGEDYRA